MIGTPGTFRVSSIRNDDVDELKLMTMVTVDVEKKNNNLTNCVHR